MVACDSGERSTMIAGGGRHDSPLDVVSESVCGEARAENLEGREAEAV
jgi:hypothetical protein